MTDGVSARGIVLGIALISRSVGRIALLALHNLDVDPDKLIALAAVGIGVFRRNGIDWFASIGHHHFASSLNANCPRSTFLNRDAAPLSRDSRSIAAYNVACGVLPAGLFQSPARPLRR